MRRLALDLPAWLLHAALALVLLVAALLPPGPVRLYVLAALTGASPLLWARRDWSPTEWLLAAPQASLLLWGLLAVPALQVPALAGVPAGVAAALAFAAYEGRQVVAFEAGAAELVGLAAAAAVAVPLGWVARSNGLDHGAFLARSWVARDGYYFIAIAQEAVERRAWPGENPFVAGVANLYPSLLQVAVGGLSAQAGVSAAEATLGLLPLLGVSTVGLGVWAALRAGRGGWGWAVALVGAAAALLLRPDLFLYPQTQAFALGLLALMLSLWAEDAPSTTEVAAGLAVGFGLVGAHTITGAAAVVFLGARGLGVLWSRERPAALRLGLALGLAALAALFVRSSALPFVPPRGPFVWAATRELSGFLAPWWTTLLALVALVAAGVRAPLRGLPVVALVGLGVAYDLSGTMQPMQDRWFVYFNAERFLFLALLVAVPLAARAAPRLGLALLGAVAVGAWQHPTGLANDTHHVWDEAPQRTEADRLAFYAQVRARTAPDARVLTLVPDYALPAFTGRAQGPFEDNLWALHMLPSDEFDARRRDMVMSGRQPDLLLGAMDRWGYTHLVAAAPTADHAQRVVASFPEGALRQVAQGGGLGLFERVRPPN